MIVLAFCERRHADLYLSSQFSDNDKVGSTRCKKELLGNEAVVKKHCYTFNKGHPLRNSHDAPIDFLRGCYGSLIVEKHRKVGIHTSSQCFL
jgi:hypothetical protein